MKRLVASVSILFLLLSFSLKTEPAGAKQRSAKSLHPVVMAGDIDQVQSLISSGADINAKGMQGMTPLHTALWYSRKAIAELLIAKGADVNVKEKSGKTPLHFVAIKGGGEVAILLIAKGADVNAKDTTGQTPLHLSANFGRKDVVEILIAKDADVNVQAGSDNALSLAKQKGHQEVVELLLEHGAKEPTIDLTGDEMYDEEEEERLDTYPQYKESTVGSKVKLKQKFLPGTYEMVHTNAKNNVTQMNNQTLPIQLSKTHWYELDASRPDASGLTTCTITVKRLKESHAGGSFDTDEPESLKSNQAGQRLSSMLEHEFVLKFGQDWQLISASGLDQIWEDIGKGAPADAQMSQEMKETMDQETFAKWMFGLVYDMIPDEPVGVGDIWNKVTSGNSPLLGTIEGDTECKLTKMEQTAEGKIAYITFTSQIESDKTTSTKIGPMSVTVKNVKMKQTGQIQLNADTGLMLKQEMTRSGDLEMSTKGPDGKDVPMTMKLNETAETTTKLIAGRFETLRVRSGRYEQARQSSHTDPLADPDEIKARIKTFEGLEEALQQISSKSRLEKGAWLQSKYDNRTSLARAIEEQVKQEMSLVRKIAVEEKAEQTIKMIDDVLSRRDEMYSKVRKELLVQKKEMKQAESLRSRSRGSSRGRSTRGRYPQGRQLRGPQDEEYMQGPYAERGRIMPRTDDSVGEGHAPQVDTETESKIREWLQTTLDNKGSLLKYVHTEIPTEYISIREVAVEEGAKKTTAAIDGILLSRQERFEDITMRMEGERMGPGQIQDPRGRYPTRGRYQQDRRSR